jgi:hypothetical protein
VSVALPAGIILRPASPLYQSLAGLAGGARLVFFAGLPGTGKSLLIHQLAHLAHARGRAIHLLQWDTARPVFERSGAGRRYPQVDGVTHGIIRVAAGRWARDAVAGWHRDHPGDDHLLIGETPFVGHRFVELARRGDDAAEELLGDPSSLFVIPVPSVQVRRHLEGERDQRARRPLHVREREDAPPQVLRDLWRQIVLVGRALGAADAATDAAADAAPDAAADAAPAYSPELYRRVYLHVLAHRRAQVMAVDEILPTASFSAYAFTVPSRDVLPEPDDTRRWILAAEEAYPDPTMLQEEIERWYVSP